ncbi:cold-shock protein [Picosynechococcus sp. NKBG042902]|uniref:cold-shock protein n=1 Tax=Picosynechococcus sp. NKBG042902 TaxID=490193 RepID=UPI0004AB9B3E|nr:cold shock domain-containing protein [Picosynechococcus sp. NKBG042902]
MKVNFGKVQRYDSSKGFGFVTQELTSHKAEKEIFFHISTIKAYSLDLAKQFDKENYYNQEMWYVFEKNKKGLNVMQIWLFFEDIPRDLQQSFEHLVGNILKDTKTTQYQKQKIKNITQIFLNEQEIQKLFGVENNSQEKDGNIFIEKDECTRARKKREANRVFINTFGLPDDLYNKIFKVERKWRINSLSHIPGGSDIVVEYNDGKVLLYDWVKKPDSYIYSFFSKEFEAIENCSNEEQIEVVRDRILRVFAKIYKDENEREYMLFEEVWNSENTDVTPWSALRDFNEIKRNEWLEHEKEVMGYYAANTGESYEQYLDSHGYE